MAVDKSTITDERNPFRGRYPPRRDVGCSCSSIHTANKIKLVYRYSGSTKEKVRSRQMTDFTCPRGGNIFILFSSHCYLLQSISSNTTFY